MTYLIIHNTQAFYTNWYSADKYTDGMVIINLADHTISFNGTDFKPITEDSL